MKIPALVGCCRGAACATVSGLPGSGAGLVDPPVFAGRALSPVRFPAGRAGWRAAVIWGSQARMRPVPHGTVRAIPPRGLAQPEGRLTFFWHLCDRASRSCLSLRVSIARDRDVGAACGVTRA